ncbi:hypothetical protein [Candidatus Palauibacter irciniicola]|uniref:hypothetical protein n=1 Tax=Candidatus Palauibacter irciniicola TaxID=3056733 RepID=UPI003B021F4F
MLVLFLVPSAAFCQVEEARVSSYSVDDPPWLCLSQVGEWALPDEFEFVGLSASDHVGPDPVITVWSRSDLIVLKLSSEAVTEAVAQVSLAGVSVLAAALVEWGDAGLVLELFDARDGTIWALDTITGEMVPEAAPIDPVAASGAIKHGPDWVWVEKILDPRSDTTQILISTRGQAGPANRLSNAETQEAPERGIDRLVHLRSDGNGGYLVQQAGFPFGTIRFTHDGTETWRTNPGPDDLREILGESDLRYVMSTPALAVDDATLSTFVALRSRRRASALTFRRGDTVRYGSIRSEVAFLAALPRLQLLVGTRTAASRNLIFLKWHWTDQRQDCS